MYIEHALVSVTRRHRHLSGDAVRISDDSSLFTIADAHGPRELEREISSLGEFIAGELQDRFLSEVSRENAARHFQEVQALANERFDLNALSGVATSLQIRPSTIALAHAGNCRLYRHERNLEGFVRLTDDHNLDLSREYGRLLPFLAGGSFSQKNYGLTGFASDLQYHRLHVRESPTSWSMASTRNTRGFGKNAFRPAFTEEPECVRIPICLDKPTIYAFCSDGGKGIVEKVFARSALLVKEVEDVDDLASMAHEILAEHPKRPKHDITIIFFRVTP